MQSVDFGECTTGFEVHRLQLPIAGHSIDHVNVHLLKSGGQLLVIDCGWSSDDARAHLTCFVTDLGYRLGDIRTLLLTHLHADHALPAGWSGDDSKTLGQPAANAAPTFRPQT